MDLKVLPWQRPEWERLVDAAASDRMPHAIMVSGVRGTGVEEFALCAAAHLLCERPSADSVCCGQCRPCELFAAGSHPDYFRLEPDPERKSEQITIDEVRDMIHFMHLSRQFTRFRVAVAFPAENINRNAANALLKTLEEPPPSSALILATHQPASLPITIRSRCRNVLLHESQSPDTARWLEERLSSSAPPAAELLRHARGAPLLAATLAEEGALSNRVEMLEDLLRLRNGKSDPVGIAEKWAKHDAGEVTGWLVGYVSDAVRLKVSGQSDRAATPGLGGHLQRLADELDLAALVAFHDAVLASWRGATGSHNLSARSILEDLIGGWLAATRRGGRQ